MWTEWAEDGLCSKTCGGGTLTKKRTCTDPAPVGAGSICPGEDTEEESCSLDPCPGMEYS